MARYVCSVCGYVHDDDKEEGRWDELPADWGCPVCGAAKSAFQPADGGSPATEGSGGASGLPNAAVTAHRVFGYVFVAIYLVLLIQMVPRGHHVPRSATASTVTG
jgi:rubredoxin